MPLVGIDIVPLVVTGPPASPAPVFIWVTVPLADRYGLRSISVAEALLVIVSVLLVRFKS